MFEKIKVGDRIKTKLSGMATVIEVGCYGGTMVKLKCDKPMWSCPYFYESELDLQSNIEIKATDKYRYCNHHHELTNQHEIVNFGDGEFVANKKAIPLLKALNELGLKTRSHHITDESKYGWFTILLDDVELEIVDVHEADADRTKYNGKKELRLTFKSTKHVWEV